jgi:hypothetical protein
MGMLQNSGIDKNEQQLENKNETTSSSVGAQVLVW